MHQSLIFLLTDVLFIPILLCHRLYISIVYVDLFLGLQQLNLENSLQMIRINCYVLTLIMYFLPTLLQFEIQNFLLGTMNCIKLHLLLYSLENRQLFNQAHIFKIINSLYKISFFFCLRWSAKPLKLNSHRLSGPGFEPGSWRPTLQFRHLLVELGLINV